MYFVFTLVHLLEIRHLILNILANAAFPPGMMGGLGGMDINNLLNNPALMNMATTMMSDPSVQQMMGQFMSGGVAQGGSPGAGGGMEGLLQA